MSMLAVIAAVEAVAIAAFLAASWRSATRVRLAPLPPSPAPLPPSPDEVAGLVAVLTAAARPGVPMTDIALAVLDAGYRKQQGCAR